MQIFDLLLVHPIINILLAFYSGLSLLHVPYALGFSIILLTIVVRLIMYPFMNHSMKQQKKMQEMAPHIARIKEKHKHDAKQQQVAQMELFKEHGVNPLAGCLPMLIQLPLFFALYQVLFKSVHLKSPTEINDIAYFSWLRLTHLWDMNFFGLPLAHTPKELLPTFGYGILLVLAVTGALQFVQSKMMMPVLPEEPVDANKKKKEDDFAASFQKQTVVIIPLVIMFSAFTFPLGLSLYWNTLTIFGIIQQYRVGGWGSMSTLFKKQ